MNPVSNMDALPLRGLHLPTPVGWWPPAPGWWLMLALTLLALMGLILGIRRRRRVTPVAVALRELGRLEADHAMAAREKLQRLSSLMKRVALSLRSRETVAGLTGDQWLLWLDDTGGDTVFSRGVGRSLADAPFRSVANDEEAAELMRHCREWLQTLAKRRKVGMSSRGPMRAA